MKAFILAAGQGTRLRPYTDDRPKCMVPLAGRPLLHYQLDVLRSAGIEDITVIGGYRADQLDTKGAPVVINQRYALTNMVATLFCATDRMLGGADVLISYGDIVFEPRVLAKVLETPGELVVAADLDWQQLWRARMADPLSDAETFRMTDGNRIVELGKRAHDYRQIEAQYIGLIRVPGERVSRLVEAYRSIDQTAQFDGNDFDNMYMTRFVEYLIAVGWDVRAALIQNGWLELDTGADLERYQALWHRGDLGKICNL